MIKHASLALMALSIAAGPAAALSCVRPDVVQAYAFAAKSDESYVILRGEFSFDRSKLPNPLGPPVEASIRANFKGKLLTGAGFTDDVEVPVTVALKCAGPWCATLSPNTDYLAFVNQSETSLTFNVGPCYQFGFANPSDEAIKQVEQCAASGECSPAQ